MKMPCELCMLLCQGKRAEKDVRKTMDVRNNMHSDYSQIVSSRSRLRSRILISPRETSTIPSPAKYLSILDTTSRAEPI